MSNGIVYDNKTVLQYWKRKIKQKGDSVSGLKVASVAILVSKMFGEEQILTKSTAYQYMRQKMLFVLNKNLEIALDTKEGCVYFVGNLENKWVKIGFTINLSKRLASVQTGCPCLLEILGYIKTKDARKLEKKIHKKFNYYKMHGEWYVLSSEIIRFIETETSKT